MDLYVYGYEEGYSCALYDTPSGEPQQCLYVGDGFLQGGNAFTQELKAIEWGLSCACKLKAQAVTVYSRSSRVLQACKGEGEPVKDPLARACVVKIRATAIALPLEGNTIAPSHLAQMLSPEGDFCTTCGMAATAYLPDGTPTCEEHAPEPPHWQDPAPLPGGSTPGQPALF